MNILNSNFDVLWDDISKTWKDDVSKEYKQIIINTCIESNNIIVKNIVAMQNECESFKIKIYLLEMDFDEYMKKQKEGQNL